MSKRIILDGLYSVELGQINHWISRERWVRRGDVRMIDGVLCYAWHILARYAWKKKEIWWRPVRWEQIEDGMYGLKKTLKNAKIKL